MLKITVLIHLIGFSFTYRSYRELLNNVNTIKSSIVNTENMFERVMQTKE